MKKILSLLLSFVFLNTIIFAEEPAVIVKNSPQQITDGSLYFLNPEWSPDGKMLAFTESKYAGIWVLNLESGNYTQVTDEIGAGFGYQWSVDSKRILTRVSKFENKRRLNAIKVFDLNSGKIQQLTEFRPLMTGLPRWGKNDEQVFLYSNEGLEFFEVENNNIEKNALIKNIERKVFYATSEGLFIRNDNREVLPAFSQQETYLNLELSPDGQKIAFEIYGGHMYVQDLAINVTHDLGIGYHPQWSPDSKKLTYMVTKDDGYQYLEADIFVINMDGSGKTNITRTDDLLETNPSWSPDGTKIAYNEVHTGIIYVLEVTPN